MGAKDAVVRRRAYNLLRLSLIWVHSLRELDPFDLAEEAQRLVVPEGRSGFRRRDLERGAVAPFLGATSLGTLKKVLLSARFWVEWASEARSDVRKANREVDRLKAKASELQQRLKNARDDIHALQDQAAESARRFELLSRKLEMERNKRINEIHETNGRLQHLFDSELAPRLRGAREALDAEPFAVDLALERLDRTLELLEEERPWPCSG